MKGPAEIQVIAKSYLGGLILKCGIFFTLGLIFTGIVLFFSANQPLGPSYQESFSQLSQLKQEMLYKSILIYCVIMFLVLSGVIFITVLYSHRVVGPMIGLKRVIGIIKGGDFTTSAILRSKDAIKPMADSLNDMIGSHRKIISDLRKDNSALQKLTENGVDKSQHEALREKVQSIASTLNQLKL